MGRNRLSPVPHILGLSLILTACATTANTPAQDRALAAYQTCRNVNANVFLDRVDPDGKVWVHMINGIAGYSDWSACMSKELEQASAKGQ